MVILFFFPSAPEEHSGVEPTCNPIPHQLGGLFWEDGGLGERRPVSERDAASVLSSGESSSARADAGQLHGLLVDPPIHLLRSRHPL